MSETTASVATLPTDIDSYIRDVGQHARVAATRLARAATSDKNAALMAAVAALDGARDALKTANQADLDANPDLDAALADRLELTPQRVDAMLEGLRQVAALPDPIGGITDLNFRPSGIQVGRMRVPLGVVGIIYESRPNVTADAAALAIKSGNAVILRGGSEALQSNMAIAACLREGIAEAGLDPHAVQVIATADRAAVGALLHAEEFVDVIVPRGGKGLIERVTAEARMPVIKHLDGNCHVFIDALASLDKAQAIAVNAKTQRFGTCNTMETLLVDDRIATTFLPRFTEAMRTADVEIRGCEATRAIVKDAVPAGEDDWYEEYLGPILAVKVVADVDAAIAHINHYGSAHTDAIVTEHLDHAQRFLREVDSSSVMVNASTRFADGFEYGLGAEVGISTDKFHARGPVGLEGLTTTKFVVYGDGHIRS